MGRAARLADESFLKDLTAGELERMCKVERDARNRQKLQVACHYKLGKTVAEAAEAACTEYENARRWIADMRKRGSAAIPRRKSTGRRRKLTRDQYRRLALDVYKGPRKCGYKANVWSYALIHRHAMEKFGVDISYTALVDNMHELRLVIKPKAGTSERFYYGQTDTPGRIGLPTASRARAGRKEAIAPEMLGKIPAQLLRSDLPVEYLANLPELLQKR